MSKQILFKKDALDRLAAGEQKLSDAVTITMGAKGQNVLIEGSFGAGLPHITKDGVTVAKSIDLKDLVENTACSLIKNIALSTNLEVGDGTTTSVSLANAIIQCGRAAIINDGVHPVMLKRGLDIQVKEIISELDKYKNDVTGEEMTREVALVSANGDEAVADLVTAVYNEVGKEGNIAIEVALNSPVSYYEKVEGIRFDRGYNNPYYINNAKGEADYNSPLILITDYTISTATEIEGILTHCANKNRPLLIICEDIDIRAEEVLINNKMSGVLKPIVVKTPEFGDRRLDILEDIAVLTGGKFVTALTGYSSISEATPDDLGSAARVTVSDEDTSIIGGLGDAVKIAERLVAIKDRILSAKDEDIRSYQEKRYARLNGGVVVIKVGGYSDIEKIELKDRVEDAVNSVKAALIDGIIPGGGAPLYRIGDKGCKATSNSKNNKDVEKGREVLMQAIKIPFRQILDNAGVDVKEIEKELVKKHKHVVYDVMSESFKNGLTAGIIDPVLVTKTALTNAVSIAGTLLTTGCTINYVQENTPPVDFNLP